MNNRWWGNAMTRGMKTINGKGCGNWWDLGLQWDFNETSLRQWVLLRLMIYPKLERFEGVPIKMEMKRRASRQRCPLNQEVNPERGSASSREFACTMIRQMRSERESRWWCSTTRGNRRSFGSGRLASSRQQNMPVIQALYILQYASVCLSMPQYWPVWFSAGFNAVCSAIQHCLTLFDAVLPTLE